MLGRILLLLIVVPLMAIIGYALQRFLLNRTLGDDLLPPLLELLPSESDVIM